MITVLIVFGFAHFSSISDFNSGGDDFNRRGDRDSYHGNRFGGRGMPPMPRGGGSGGDRFNRRGGPRGK